MRSLVLFAASALLLAASSATADPLAFRLSPMSRDFSPAGRSATGTFEVINPGDAPIAISTRVTTRVVDAAGAERNESADREFLIYPAQVIIPPRGSQQLRVTWLGAPHLDREQAFRLEVAQVPLDRLGAPNANARSVGQLKLMLRYLASIYVRPDGAQPRMKVAHAGLERDGQGRARLSVTLSNEGQAHASLRELTVKVRAHGASTATELRPMEAQPNGGAVVLPGGIRHLDFAWPASLPEGPIDIAVSPRPRG